MCCISYPRDCSLFIPKGGSVIFKQFRHMKNLPLPGSGYFKKLPPVYVTGLKCNPPPHPSGRDVPPIAKLCTTRVLAGQPMNQNPLQGHLWSYSMEALNKESEFATLHVLFQWPLITLHEFLSGDENADQFRIDQETVSELLKSMDTEYDRSILRAIIALLHTWSDPILARRKLKLLRNAEWLLLLARI